MKFKIGDKVVTLRVSGVVLNDRSITEIPKHTTVTVNEDSTTPYIKTNDGIVGCLSETSLEHEHVFNSPLYKELS